ncbi:MAG: hypothetical protein PVJ86_05160 [Phycisphaerales bacterium]
MGSRNPGVNLGAEEGEEPQEDLGAKGREIAHRFMASTYTGVSHGIHPIR